MVIGVFCPLAGVVFVVDGVLIGAGDGRWLAGAMGTVLVLYLPLVLAVRWQAPTLVGFGEPAAMAVLWVVFNAFMAIRWAFLWFRVRGDAWLVTGASLERP